MNKTFSAFKELTIHRELLVPKETGNRNGPGRHAPPASCKVCLGTMGQEMVP